LALEGGPIVTHPERRIEGASSQGAVHREGRSRTQIRIPCAGDVVRAWVRTEARRGSRSEGQVVVGRAVGGGGGRGVANGAPVTHEGVAEGAGAPADGMSERDDGPLLLGPVEVVDEGHVLGHEGTHGDVERVLEQNDGGELGGVDEVGHGWRGRDGR